MTHGPIKSDHRLHRGVSHMCPCQLIDEDDDDNDKDDGDDDVIE